MANEFQAIADKFDQLSGEQMRTIQRKALTKVGDLIQAAVVAHAPEKAEGDGGLLAPGELKASIKARVQVPTDTQIADGLSARVVVGPTGFANTVANWVENGHVARRSGKKEGPPRFVPAHPFIRPAADETEQKAIDTYTESVTADVQIVMK